MNHRGTPATFQSEVTCPIHSRNNYTCRILWTQVWEPTITVLHWVEILYWTGTGKCMSFWVSGSLQYVIDLYLGDIQHWQFHCWLSSIVAVSHWGMLRMTQATKNINTESEWSFENILAASYKHWCMINSSENNKLLRKCLLHERMRHTKCETYLK